jgi:hypothetical protein
VVLLRLRPLDIWLLFGSLSKRSSNPSLAIFSSLCSGHFLVRSLQRDSPEDPLSERPSFDKDIKGPIWA